MQIGVWAGVFLLVIVMVALEFWNRKRMERKQREKLRNAYGRAREKRALEPERLKEISIYYNLMKEAAPEADWVDEVTWQDLDLDRIFEKLNHTVSFAGEQLLYSELHHLSESDAEQKTGEQMIQFLDSHPEAREKVWDCLLPLKKETVNYYIPEYVSLLEMQRFPLLKFCLGLLASLLLLTVAALLTRYPLIIGAAVANLLINVVVYAFGKMRYEVFLSSMGCIIQIVRTAKGILEIESESGKCNGDCMMADKDREEIARCLKGMEKISRMVANMERKKYAGMTGDIFALISDYLIGALMWDFITYDRIARLMENRQDDLMRLYRFVGEVDMGLAVASWRRSLENYCVPEFDHDHFIIEEIRHPLMNQAVGNSLEMHKNILITGSNASGKSTFIKAVASNLILGQTIHTCTAKKMVMPWMSVLTSMAVRDDILTGESYYVKEIRYLGRMVERSGCRKPVFFGIDEILRGTNTMERLAASIAILRYFKERGSIVMVASHDLELARELDGDYDNYYFCDTVEGSDVVFDYRLRKGICNSQNAIRLLTSMGFPAEITDDAKRRCS
ncbi:MAG: hypothetical protein ACI4BB_08275 [Coprococcus sp.]